ncbi:hypothetical protein AB0K00_30095 [Dactylosporangium sp. NPDC049525]|uniref:hypothetical protein n=1 Tax=Dactylosporangium sp. NPDC049525 TaxID=3154730 RepID=UPI003433F348
MRRRWWQRTRPEPPVAQAVADLPRGGGAACDRLLTMLAEIDAGRDQARSRAALDILARAPDALAAVDHHARRSDDSVAVLRVMAAGLDSAAAGPITVALASVHGNGRVRERAVRAILHHPDPVLAPFLVLRAGDWVRQVRDRAGLGVAVLLAEDPGTYLPVTLPVALRIQARARSRFVMNQLVAAVLAAPPATREALAAAGNTAQRRLVFDLDRAQGRLTLAGLVALAETDSDPRIRAQAAEAACREAVWTDQTAILRRLAGGRRTEVRVTALAGLLRLGRPADVAAYLDDPASLVRAVAREGARRAGTDVVAHYRATVTGATPTSGAVAGYAETVPSDSAPLLPLLAHPDRTVRAQAVRAVARLGGVTPDRIAPLLRDPAPAVVREAATALRPLTGRLPDRLPWELLTDGRPEVRRAGYRLLNGGPPLVRLRAALTLTLDPAPDLARRGRADVTCLARAATDARVRRRFAGDLIPAAGERAELDLLARRAADRLGERTSDRLREWLSR